MSPTVSSFLRTAAATHYWRPRLAAVQLGLMGSDAKSDIRNQGARSAGVGPHFEGLLCMWTLVSHFSPDSDPRHTVSSPELKAACGLWAKEGQALPVPLDSMAPTFVGKRIGNTHKHTRHRHPHKNPGSRVYRGHGGRGTVSSPKHLQTTAVASLHHHQSQARHDRQGGGANKLPVPTTSLAQGGPSTTIATNAITHKLHTV